ncbi:MAG: glycosyltransferase [Bdellovibrionota bacterium]
MTTNKNFPLVSICIPTRNGAEFLDLAIRSALDQTYPNLEIIVSDDNSTDGTRAIVERHKSEAKIPFVLHVHEPRGMGANWNNAIELSKGKYIKFLFQDDLLEPRCVEEMVRVLEEHPQMGMVASKRVILVDENYDVNAKGWIEKYGDLQKDVKLKRENGIGFLDKEILGSDAIVMSPVNKVGEPMAALIRKEVFSDVGLFSEQLSQLLDMEFYTRVLRKYRIGIIDRPLVKYRLHAQQTTQTSKRDEFPAFEYILFKKHFLYLNWKLRFRYLNRYSRVFRVLSGGVSRLSRLFGR